jgi:hypothetical protein
MHLQGAGGEARYRLYLAQFTHEEAVFGATPQKRV